MDLAASERLMRSRLAAVVVGTMALAVGACGGSGGVDPTPEKLDGSASREFESEDIERANNASEAVREYCAGAVSEAQEVGCLSHVDEGDIP
jgi:hypothetical protein